MQDENKQSNKLEETKGNSTSLSLSTIAVFKDNPSLVYLYKKTEKLVSAVYMLSNFISDMEPVKWQLREAGVEMLSQSLSLSNRSASERMSAYSGFINTGLKFLSFLEVSFLGGIISEMNYNILKYEFESLIQTAEAGEKDGGTKSVVFPNNFFAVAPVVQSQTLTTQKVQVTENTPTNFPKGQNIVSDRLSIKKSVETVRPSELKQKDKTNRQDIIIGLLKKNNELGIKDFVSSIKDCGEKTIQRELVYLVAKGLIKKEGEKRWSRYSLK